MIKFEKQAEFFTLTSKLSIPKPLSEVFPFFADATNLERITPTFLNFKILTPQPIIMHQGLLLDYQIKLHNLPLKWQSEITLWDPPHQFIDEQRRGPYREWVHLHAFKESTEGTDVIDFVKYKVWGADVIERLFVRKNLQQIFTHRLNALAQYFR